MPGYNPNKDIQRMIKKYVEGTATAEEITFVESYYAWKEHNAMADHAPNDQDTLREESFNNIKAQLSTPKSGSRTITFLRLASIAAAVLIAATTSYIFLKQVHPEGRPTEDIAGKSLDIAPGSNTATLTLADGSRIRLDDKASGNVKELPGLVITKTRKGELIYTTTHHPGAEFSNAKNTITTPRGGQYQVILPDGTHVWLNAASSLTYPQSFAGKTRSVRLEGEAYFEVAKVQAMPFNVFTGSQNVEVTGTHFNINAYMDEEAIETTLLEGGITVHHQGRSQRIKPGQRALVLSNSSAFQVDAVDTDAIVAWKNGVFDFNNASLSQVMNQLERWYDIKVNYSSLPAKRYTGMVPRGANLSRVLNMLELTGNIRFKIENNRQLTVMPER
jgi:transmembrane sensor